jgi:hypothetical protein
MNRLQASVLALSLALVPAPVFAGPNGFSIQNGTGLIMTGLTIRNFPKGNWRELAGSAGPGARTTLKFEDANCAFDIQATLQGVGPVVWKSVNLCEVKTVVLNRNAQGVLWVDYE